MSDALREMRVAHYDPGCSICRDQAGKARAGLADSALCYDHAFLIARFALRSGDGWVSVKDGWPTKRGEYLIHRHTGRIALWEYVDKRDWLDNGVTHWRPLPAPPGEAEKPVESAVTECEAVERERKAWGSGIYQGYEDGIVDEKEGRVNYPQEEIWAKAEAARRYPAPKEES